MMIFLKNLLPILTTALLLLFTTSCTAQNDAGHTPSAANGDPMPQPMKLHMPMQGFDPMSPADSAAILSPSNYVLHIRAKNMELMHDGGVTQIPDSRAFQSHLQKEKSNINEAMLFLKIDDGVGYETFVEVIDALQAEQIEHYKVLE